MFLCKIKEKGNRKFVSCKQLIHRRWQQKDRAVVDHSTLKCSLQCCHCKVMKHVFKLLKRRFGSRDLKCMEEWTNVQVGDVTICALRINLLYDFKMNSIRIQRHNIKNKQIN